MEYTTLGRTGLKVSVAGLGCGGFSRLGLATGKTEAEAIAVVRTALDLGVNFIDTAAPYRTEHVVGEAIQGRRDQVVLATKATVFRGNDPVSSADVVASLDNSLRLLKTDMIDVFQCHAVRPHMYPHVRDAILPALLKEQREGKIPLRRHHRDGRGSGTPHAGRGCFRWPLGHRDAGLFHDEPECKASGLSPDPLQQGRHADDVRRAPDFRSARTPARPL